MNIARFEPWSYLDLLHRDLDRMVGSRSVGRDSQDPVADWVPAVDIIEEKTRFVLRADVPGVNPEDIEISMDNGILSVSGERRSLTGDDDAALQRIERATGRFYRRFTLPESVDAEAITARCQNGILEVAVPKAPEIQARRITVEAA